MVALKEFLSHELDKLNEEQLKQVSDFIALSVVKSEPQSPFARLQLRSRIIPICSDNLYL